MFSVEEVGCREGEEGGVSMLCGFGEKERNRLTAVRRVERHGFEAVGLFQYGAGPLPQPTHLAQASELSAVLCDRRGVPVLETHVRVRKVCEESFWIRPGVGARRSRAVTGSLGWRRFLDPFVEEVTVDDVSTWAIDGKRSR